jgi:hypothetical protein
VSKALQLGYDTAKLGIAIGLFFFALTTVERLSRWTYKSTLDAVDFWGDEIRKMRYGRLGETSDEVELDEGWEIPGILPKTE